MILDFLFKIKMKLRAFVLRYADTPLAGRFLALLSFAESSFFPIPPDILLIAILTSHKTHRWFYYSAITTIFSVLGGIFAYAMGFFFYESVGQAIVSFYSLGDSVAIVRDFFNDNAFIAIFIAGFTPIPYKLFTLSAGFFEINFLVFIIASILSRSLRFFGIGYIMKVFGKNIAYFIFKYFNAITLLIALAALAFLLLRFSPF